MSWIKNNKLGQIFFTGLQGYELKSSEEKFIEEKQIGGVILFSRNLKSPEQIYKLSCKLKTLTSEPLWIGVDMEGGRVHRLKQPFTQWPSLSHLEKKDKSLAYEMAFFMGKEMQSVGLNLNFTPCLDLRTNPQNTVIGDRSLGENPEKVLSLAENLINGYKEAEIFCCTKHFPGHGDTLVDSHENLPKENRRLENLKKRELLCYKKPLSQMIMTAHILFQNVDSCNPVTFSSRFLKNILRESLEYKDLIISDDLNMKALRLYYPLREIPLRALKAGCNLLLYCDDKFPLEVFSSVEESLKNKEIFHKVEESLKMIYRVKRDFFKKIKNPYKRDFSVIGCKKHKKLASLIKQ